MTEARIDVENLNIGEGAILRHCVEVEGRSVTIGRNLYMDAYAHIGGGSCFDVHSSLVAGDYLHMGRFSHINTAREVVIGDEVGLGIGTKVFTHGAYLSALDGFPYKFAPVHIGSRVWLPYAIVNPGVTIGDDVVVLPNSVVTKDLPDGCLAAGTPAKVISELCFPKRLTDEERLAILEEVFSESREIAEESGRPYTDVEVNQFRRYGIRGNA